MSEKNSLYLRLDRLYVFLNTFVANRTASKGDISLKTRLSNQTIDKCLAFSSIGKLIEMAGGDNRRQNYRITQKGRQFLKALEVAA